MPSGSIFQAAANSMIYNNFNFNERQPFIPNEMNNMMNNISFQPKANFFNPIINDFVNMIPYYYK